MAAFLKRQWQTLLLTVIALAIVYIEFNSVYPDKRLNPVSFDNPFYVAMGKWGIRLLLISLAITPLYNLTGWHFPIRLRKPAGLLAFMFISIHVALFVYNNGYYSGEITLFERLINPYYILFGVGAFVILAAMALTSLKFTTRLMGQYWKPLHRMVYVAGILGVLHSLLVATNGKRAVFGGEESAVELRIYLVILVLLLASRIPIVKYNLQRLLPFGPNPRKRKPKRKPAAAV